MSSLGTQAAKASPSVTLLVLGQKKGKMTNRILVLKCVYPEVTSVISTHVLLAKASHMTSPKLRGAGKSREQ